MLDTAQLDVYETALDKAVLGLFQDPPLASRGTRPAPSTFITTIYTGMVKRWDPAIPTACTDGITLRINPTWFMSLSVPMRCTLLAHECWHVAFLHCDKERVGDRDHRTWNAACDYAINWMLHQFGYHFDPHPTEPGKILGLLDGQYQDMSAEQIYDKLVSENTPIQLPFGEDFVSADDEQNPGSKHEVVGLVVRALQLSRMNPREAGTVPGSIEEMIDKLLNPKLPWYKLLAKYLNERADQGYNWRAPNRRYSAHNMYLPSAGGQEGLSHLLWGVDDSGSMSAEVLKIANSELKGAKERLKPKSMTVVSFDSQIQDTWEFSDEDDLNRLTFTGRGGTNIQPLFDFARAMKNRPSLIVVMSDLECEQPPNPGIPVLWIRFGDRGFSPSYGRLITVDN